MSMSSRIMNAVVTVAVAAGASLALIDTAFAYIDPGTGTMLLQIAGAMIAAGLFYLRSARLWLGRRFGFGRTDSISRADTQTDADKPQ